MSLMEDVRSLDRRIEKRLRQLEPLVDEYNELQKIAGQLGLDERSQPARRAPRRQSPRRRAARRSGPAAKRTRAAATGGTRAMGAERRARILSIIAERPGVTVAELSQELGVERTSIHRIVRKLQQGGEVAKNGQHLQPA